MTAAGISRRPGIGVVAASCATAGVVLLPMLRNFGSVLFLDAVTLPVVSFPKGLFGLGPDVVRRFPLYLPLWLISLVTGGAVAWRICLMAMMASASLGTARLVRVLDPAGARWASVAVAMWLPLTPYVLTRLSSGHVEVLATLAVVPWVLAATLTDGPKASRCGAVVAAAFLGPTAAVSSLVALAGSIQKPFDALTLVRRWVLRNLVWIVPGAIVAVQRIATFADPAYFAPRWKTLSEVVSIPLGSGYWDPSVTVTRWPKTMAAVSLVLVALASVGWSRLGKRARRCLRPPLVIGYGLPVAAGLPVIGPLVHALARTPVGLPFREPHRLVAVGLVAFLALVAIGLAGLRVPYQGRVVRKLPAAACVGLGCLAFAGSGLSSTHARLKPVRVPPGWLAARQLLAPQQGTRLVLPWHEYLALPVARGPVFNPVPDMVGGDVVSSFDPELGPVVNEAADRRASRGREIDAAMRRGEDVGLLLDSIAAEWVVIVVTDDWSALDLRPTADLHPVLLTDDIRVYRRRLTAAAAIERLVPFLLRQTSDGTVLGESGRWGWYDGIRAVGTTTSGALRARRRGAVMWHVPSLLVLLSSLVSGWFGMVRVAAIIRKNSRGAGSECRS
jgi:hypothetical protein